MQLNVFDWIREGVKRSVILGVSDAMEAIGSPDGDDVHARLAQLLPAPATAEAAQGSLAGGGKRKRLGRSLREFEGGAE
jgi:hypothetical protein